MTKEIEPAPALDNPANPDPTLNQLAEPHPAADPQYQEYLENRDEFLKWVATKGVRKEVVGDEYPKWLAGPDVEVKDAEEEKKVLKAHKK